jgi:hypothetical protein
LSANPAIALQQERLKYPGMLPREVLVFRGWLKFHEREFDGFDWNTRIGKGVDPGEGWSISDRRMAVLNSRKRIDVVAWKSGRVTLIEVEDNPGLSNFGQIIGYEVLWRDFVDQRGPSGLDVLLGIDKYYPPDLPLDRNPRLLVVCARIGDDAMMVLTRSGVLVEVIPTDFSSLRRVK